MLMDTQTIRSTMTDVSPRKDRCAGRPREPHPKFGTAKALDGFTLNIAPGESS